MSGWRSISRLGVLVLGLGLAQVKAAEAAEPFVVEYYYKAKWGHVGEFLELYKKNHYPILAKMKEQGWILEMGASTPRYHAGEQTRWDFRFTIVWKDFAATQADKGEDQIIDELYPDRKTFEEEEQRRFQILLEHMDVPIERRDLSQWQVVP